MSSKQQNKAGDQRRKNSPAGAAALAAKTVVQLLFATGKSYTVDGLRERLREFFRDEARREQRAVAELNVVEIITAILDGNRQLSAVGLQLRISGGVVSLHTTAVENDGLANFLHAQGGVSDAPELTAATFEVLACIAFKQPIGYAEIDHLFGADKRSMVAKLRDACLVEEFTGDDGRLRFATTAVFLQRFGLNSLEELSSAFAAQGHSAENRS